MNTLRHSTKRTAILENLQSRYDHPSADMIYLDIKKIIPSISLGTVYRNLQLLCDTNQIQKIQTNDQLVHYDANMHDHHHFICKECQSIYDVEATSPSTTFSDHCVDFVDIVYYGTCKDCKQKQGG